MNTITLTEQPASIDWTTRRGDTFLKEFNIKQGGELVDLDGSDFVMVAKDNRGTPIKTFEIGDGITIVSLGRVRIHETAENTAEWPTHCDTTFELKWTRPTIPVVEKTILVGKI